MKNYNIITNIILYYQLNQGFNNLQEEMDNIMMSKTTQDLELIQL
jgi:hypothetical protein